MTETDCEVTASKILRQRFPYYNKHVNGKNRLTDHCLIQRMPWTTGHLYIHLSKAGCHHCILIRNHDYIEIYDSFYNHRSLTHRAMPVDEFWRLFCLLFNNEAFLAERCIAYQILFLPPDDYLANWTGLVERVYLAAVYL